MINCRKNKFPERDGTNQQQRYLKALQYSYVQIDERNFKDLLKFFEEFARLVKYYNFHNEQEGNWSAFYYTALNDLEDKALKKKLREIISQNEPHLALSITFILLFRYAQNHLNTLTKKHIDFYYKDILRLQEKHATPDITHVIIKLAKHIAGSYLIPKGTVLTAGKDATGKPLYYKTLSDASVNQATIEKLKTIYRDANESRIYSAPVANSTDGLGKDPNTSKWDTFGKNQKDNNQYVEPRTMIDANIGFAIASPVLWLREGNRSIKFKVFLKGDPDEGSTITGSDLSKAFRIYLSGEKGWIDKQIISDGIFNKTENSIVISAVLLADDPAITAYSEEIFMEGYPVSVPMAKIILNNSNNKYPYKLLSTLTIKSITVDIDIKDTKTVYVQNNMSVLDGTKTFQPFGSSPSIGDEFYIGHAEAFQKKLKSFSVQINWQNAPSNFRAHYSDYYSASPENTSFTFGMKLLFRKIWYNLTPVNKCLFNTPDATTSKTIEVTTIDGINSYQTDVKGSEIGNYNPGTVNGFIKIQLTGPTSPINAFGHKDYPKIYTERIINKTKPVTKAAANTTIPNEPYTPAITSLAVDYCATEVIIDDTGTSGDKNTFFHIGAFGYETFKSGSLKTGTTPLLPQFRFQGSLFIGLKDLTPPCLLSLLFQVAEGSGDISIKPRPSIKWDYLSGNEWINFQPNQVLMDSTQEFRNSGVITFYIPRSATANVTVADKGLHWLIASVSSNASSINNMVQILPQVAIAGFSENDNDPGHLEQALPANSITKLAVNDPSVKSVKQPFASFGGKTKEQSKDFYPRVSERLKHKNRAITIWDYEHLVLEHFPSVYKVKCLPHTDEDGNTRSGNVTLIVISNLYNKNAIDPLRPLTGEGEMGEIKEWLEGQLTLNRLISPFVSVWVKNPAFEEIEVKFKVKFVSGDPGLNLSRLNEDIKKYLSPWAYKEGADVVFEGRIHKSLIINYVENLEYVDYITNFSMSQTTYENQKLEDIPVAEATRPDIVLVSAKNHPGIEFIEEDCQVSI